jgi:hypothetical protein
VSRLDRWRRRRDGARRILFPFLGSALSERSLEATLRLAAAQDATLVPVYLAIVPKALSLTAPLGSECEGALAMLELIDQRAGRAGVNVDSRIERGRTPRHALETTVGEERFDTIVLPAATSSSDGFSPAEVAWALEAVPGEVLVLRPERPAA